MIKMMNWLNIFEIDSFFGQLTECFIEILSKGLADFSSEKISFGCSNVDCIFYTGMECIQSAFHPDVTQIFLDTKILSITSKGQCSEEDIFKMYILKRVIIAFQASDIESFSILNHQIGSTADASYNDMRLKSIR